MHEYDPQRTPPAKTWLALSESERLDLVQEYHRRRRIRLPNAMLHAVVHVIIENQIAMRDPPEVMLTLARLMKEGLDRHDALHAIALVLTRHMNDLMQSSGSTADPNPAYVRDVIALTAAKWRSE